MIQVVCHSNRNVTHAGSLFGRAVTAWVVIQRQILDVKLRSLHVLAVEVLCIGQTKYFPDDAMRARKDAVAKVDADFHW
ncbi:MAG: hypothetical protein JNK87_20715 [Bryobacterales bacterium]|nr:hypothetical protein [Bryobacterales bacterium]